MVVVKNARHTKHCQKRTTNEPRMQEKDHNMIKLAPLLDFLTHPDGTPMCEKCQLLFWSLCQACNKK